MEDANKKFYGASVGRNTRLKNGYIIHCDEAIKDANGEIIELKCTYYPESRSGSDTSGIKAKGTLHWVSVEQAINVEVRLYDHLFTEAEPIQEGKDFMDFVNPNSLTVLKNVYVEPSLANAKPLDQFQFLRKGYFCVDQDSTEDKLVFNRTVAMKTWKKK